MARMLLIPVLSVGLAIQGLGPSLIRLGPTGDRVTADDLGQITRLSNEKGGLPWVLIGHQPPMVDSARWFVNVYLEPDRQTPAIRRGVNLTLMAVLPRREAYDAVKTWLVNSVGEFAQVTVRGSEPRVVGNGRDVNRPFRIVGAMADQSIVGIVELIRTSPTVPTPASTQAEPVARIFTRVEGEWPIDRFVVRDSSTVEVYLLDTGPREKSGQKVVLRRADGKWAIDRLFAWIAD